MFRINLDLSDLYSLYGIDEAAVRAVKREAETLAAATHAHIAKLANERLHTRREIYVNALDVHPIDDGTWVVSLKAEARWIDDGMEAHSMVDDLLANSADVAKDGSRYRVIPFRHAGGVTRSTPGEKTLFDTIRRELKGRGIPYQGIESGSDGSPLLTPGNPTKPRLLHAFDILNKPIKTANGPATGKGPIGQAMQGPTGIPLLQGVRVYQSQFTHGSGPKEGQTGVKRSIMTFRIVSDRHKDEGRWEHPGIAGVNLFEEGAEWARKHFEEVIAPRVIAKLRTEIA